MISCGHSWCGAFACDRYCTTFSAQFQNPLTDLDPHAGDGAASGRRLVQFMQLHRSWSLLGVVVMVTQHKQQQQ